jgi:hypothetical protein
MLPGYRFHPNRAHDPPVARAPRNAELLADPRRAVTRPDSSDRRHAGAHARGQLHLVRGLDDGVGRLHAADLGRPYPLRRGLEPPGAARRGDPRGGPRRPTCRDRRVALPRCALTLRPLASRIRLRRDRGHAAADPPSHSCRSPAGVLRTRTPAPGRASPPAGSRPSFRSPPRRPGQRSGPRGHGVRLARRPDGDGVWAVARTGRSGTRAMAWGPSSRSKERHGAVRGTPPARSSSRSRSRQRCCNRGRGRRAPAVDVLPAACRPRTDERPGPVSVLHVSFYVAVAV